MRKFKIVHKLLIPPFNEPASALTVLLNGTRPAPLELHLTETMDSVILKLLREDEKQRKKVNKEIPLELDLMSIYELERNLEKEVENPRYNVDPYDEMIVYRDNLYIDREFIDYFIRHARQQGRPCQAVLSGADRAWATYSIPLSSLVEEGGDEDSPGYYRVDLWYFPHGWAPSSDWHPLQVPSDFEEKGYYNVPGNMASFKPGAIEEEDRSGEHGQDLTHYLTRRSCVPIESWVHIFNANVPLGVFSRGHRFEEGVSEHNFQALKIMFRAILEQRQMLSCSEAVKVGKNCEIDPSAIILGPTTIGDNCKIGPGVIVDNCALGNNVTLANNCHLMLSVVGDNCFLPFRAALFMTTVMEATIIAQNTCLQMCVLGRNSFVGAGTTFTDFNLLSKNILALDAYGELSDIKQSVIGSCIGHHVRVGAGMLIWPARIIESDVVVLPTPDRRVISRSVSYDMSDHHTYPLHVAKNYSRDYPRRVTMDEEQVLEEW